jgi:hypothetical protein
MPSRKQRKRRQKDRRHEYEYVYVDGDGHELESPPPEAERRPQKARASAGRGKGGGRPLREYQPPSWKRSGRRAAIFCPLFFIVFTLVNKHASIEARLLMSVGYSALFVPLTYLMDRTAYRTYLRRSGGPAAAKRR